MQLLSKSIPTLPSAFIGYLALYPVLCSLKLTSDIINYFTFLLCTRILRALCESFVYIYILYIHTYCKKETNMIYIGFFMIDSVKNKYLGLIPY